MTRAQTKRERREWMAQFAAAWRGMKLEEELLRRGYRYIRMGRAGAKIEYDARRHVFTGR